MFIRGTKMSMFLLPKSWESLPGNHLSGDEATYDPSDWNRIGTGTTAKKNSIIDSSATILRFAKDDGKTT